MTETLFVTGTNTEVGKTYATAALLHAAGEQGLKTAAVKPIASGCEQTAEGLRNSDALTLIEAMNQDMPYEQVNPVALEPAIAPHIAAMEAGRRLDVSRLEGICRGVMSSGADLVLIEGAGGWRVPLGPRQFLSDLPRALELPVILVVSIELGCINHALLTAEAIRRDGLPLAGWVANFVRGPQEDMVRAEENLMTLRAILPAPCLGTLPHDESGDYRNGATHLDLSPLLSSSN
ncbi:dethiobiotin synthase [Microbulbifer agarilyticus]|uniref:dethiobiotin synthase n=1 Tax=Microbulbifer agarilyticus TaxID=260552 RepID=UPI001CD2DD67|nr:dethiobiotin synthase [Microbulbifer agarilyticus]MCA0892510.1 dethiobiotin synthase [Microbulbifer agarilyticus]